MPVVSEDDPSWIEARWLIITQLRSLEAALKDLGQKIDAAATATRETIDALAKENCDDITEMKVRMASMDARLKVGAAIIAGGVSMLTSAVITFLSHSLR